MTISPPTTPNRERASSSFVSPGQATGPRVPILGTPGRSKFGSKSIIGLSTPPSPSHSSAAVSRAVSPSPRGRAPTEDIKPSTSELGYASGLLRAGSATPSLSPSESASNIGATRSTVSRTTRRSSVAPYRARSVTRSPSPIMQNTGTRVGGATKTPLFFSENDDDDGLDAMSCASTPIEVDTGDDDVVTLLATRGGKSLPSDSPRSISSSKPSSSVATENLPKFKPHPNGFDLTELRLLQDDLLLQLFSGRGDNKERLEEIREEYGFRSVFELRKLMSEITRRGLDSNEGKFFTTSIEDPRRSYPPKKTVINDPANPFCID